MKLYWSARSPFVRKVAIVIHELGIAEQVEFVRMPVASTEPNHALLPDNPLGKIPTLVLDDGSCLFDSRVICEYLDTAHGRNKLVPLHSEPRWTALKWQALGDGMLDALLIWRQERAKEATLRNEKLVAAFAVKLQATLAHLESEAAAIAATDFGVGHIAIGCALSYIDYRFPDIKWRDKHAALAAWHTSFERRPSVQVTVPKDE